MGFVKEEDLSNFFSIIDGDYRGYTNFFEGLALYRDCRTLNIIYHPFLNAVKCKAIKLKTIIVV